MKKSGWLLALIICLVAIGLAFYFWPDIKAFLDKIENEALSWLNSQINRKY